MREEPDQERLLKPVRQRRERRDRGRREGERSVGQNLAMIGVLGWLVLTPTLLGILAGRWLDRHLGTGIFWSATFIFLGLMLGCFMAWRRIHQP